MNRERWLAVSPHLDRALALEPAEQRDYLGKLRASEPALVADLEALLADADAADAEGFLDGAAIALPQPTSLAGQTFGAYELVAPLGQGGMGSVWLAHRCDGRFEGQVAVKLLSAALVTPAGQARFRREGSILARLRHPNIAQLIDAGVTALGQPYLVLEHVAGEPVDDYCDIRRLGIEERLQLFLKVLSAVEHAHTRLVVHRDLKPSNILVSKDGQVKLLDFGVAKLLEPEDGSGDATQLTGEAGTAFTPAFAAPEQVTGEAITTATDVYSLGALLYLLLTGHHPAEDVLTSQAELLRAIVHVDPQRPSDAVVGSSQAAMPSPAQLAMLRASTPERLRRRLLGDLDTVIAKALKKVPEERYPSAAALAGDLGRFLNSEPITARPDSLAYRSAKFLRRHRLPVALGGLAVLALAIGLATALVQRATAVDARARAESTVTDLHKLSQSMLFRIFDDVRQLPNSLPIASEIVRSATEVLDRTSADAAEDSPLLPDLAAGHERLSSLLGQNPAFQRSLDQPDAARKHLQRAVEIRRRLAARPGATFEDRLALARSLDLLARVNFTAGHRDEGHELRADSLRRLTALESETSDPAFVRYCLAVVHARGYLRDLHDSPTPIELPGHTAGSRHVDDATRLWREFAEHPPARALAERDFAESNGVLGSNALHFAGAFEHSLMVSDLTLAALDALSGSRSETWSTAAARNEVLDMRVDTLRELGRPEEALAAAKELVPRMERARADDSSWGLAGLINLMGLRQDAATLAALVGDFDFADLQVREADALIGEAEKRFGTPAFAPARVEFGWNHTVTLRARAERATSRDERRRLLTAALDACRGALALADDPRSGAQGHGFRPEVVAALREAEGDLVQQIASRP